jgi:hypothetical protein
MRSALVSHGCQGAGFCKLEVLEMERLLQCNLKVEWFSGISSARICALQRSSFAAFAYLSDWAQLTPGNGLPGDLQMIRASFKYEMSDLLRGSSVPPTYL